MTGISDPLVGDVLDGRYEIVAKLARGGMATVYRAHDRRLGRGVAIKIMHVGLGSEDDTDFARKFDQEARAAAALADPHVVGVFDQGVDRGRPYIVMEYIEGVTLRNVIVREAPLSPAKAFTLIEPIVSALAAAHSSGLVHRDVKPENVLISKDGKVKVADFGLARVLTDEMTATQGLLIGTVSYLPPERVSSGRADARSDIYSVGVVLYELLTGHKPYTGEVPIQVAYAHVNNDIPPPSQETSYELPDYVDALVLACTRRDPKLRPMDGRELLSRVKKVRKALAERTASDPRLATLVGAPKTMSDVTVTEAITTEWKAAAPSPKEVTGPLTPISPVESYTNSDDVFEPSSSAPAPSVRSPRSPSSVRSPSSQRTPIFPEISHTVVHKRRRRIVGIILLVLVLTGLSTYAWWHFAGRFTRMPTIVNHTETDAIRIARNSGLTISFDRAHSETVPAGSVISSDPPAGARVRKKQQVHAVISRGPERYAVPQLVGLSLAEAKSELLKSKLAVGKVTEAYHEEVAKGRVASAGLGKDVLVKKDTPIDLVVSLGPKPRAIANFTGKSAKTATETLKAAQLEVEVVEDYSATVPAGIVISQIPTGGELPRGGKVRLVVSKGPKMVTVPQVKWRGIESAKKILEDAGFKVAVADPNDSSYGIVRSTNPDAGTSVPEGSTITLHLL